MADPIDRSGQALNFLSKLNKMVIPKMQKFGNAFDRLSMSLKKKGDFGDSWKGASKLNKELKKGSSNLKGVSANIGKMGKESKTATSYLQRIDEALKGISAMSAINIWQNLGRTETIGTAEQQIMGLHDALYRLSIEGPEQLQALRSSVFAIGRDFVRQGIPIMPDEIADAMTAVVDAGIRGTESIARYTKEVAFVGKAFDISSSEAAEFFYTAEEGWGLGIEAGKAFAGVAFEISKNFNISANEVISSMKELEQDFNGIMLSLPETARKRLLQGASTTVAMAKSMFMDSGNELNQAMTKFLLEPAEAMSTLGKPLSYIGVGLEEAKSMVKKGELDVLFVKIAEGMSKMGEGYPEHVINKMAQDAGVTYSQWKQMTNAFETGAISMDKLKSTTEDLNKQWDDNNSLNERTSFLYSRLTEALNKVKSTVMNYGGAIVDVSGEALEALTTLGMAVAPMVFVAREMGFSLEKMGEKLGGLTGKLPGFSKNTEEATGVLSKFGARMKKQREGMRTYTASKNVDIMSTKAYNKVTERLTDLQGKLTGSISKTIKFFKLDKAATLGLAIAKAGLTAATWALNVALIVLTSPITLIIGAIALLTAGVVALMMHWDKLGKVMADGMNWIADFGEKAISFLQKLPDRIIAFLDDIPQFIESAIMGTGDMAETGFTKAFKRLMPVLGKLTLTLLKFAFWDMPVRILPKLIVTTFHAAGKLLGLGMAKLFYDILVPKTKEGISAIGSFLKDFFKMPAAWISSLGLSALDALTGFFKRAQDATANSMVKIVTFVASIPYRVIDIFKSVGSAILDVITWPYEKAINAIGSLFNIENLGSRMKTGLKDSLASVFDIVTSPFKAAWNWLFGNTLYDFTVIPTKINEISASIIGAILAPFKAAFNVIVSLWENLQPIVEKAINALWAVMPWFIKKPIEYLFKGETTEVKKVEKVEAKRDRTERKTTETAEVISLEMNRLVLAVEMQTQAIVKAIQDSAPEKDSPVERGLKFGFGPDGAVRGLADFWQKGSV